MGYFLTRFKFSIRKFIKLVFETIFYTLLIFLIMLVCTDYPFSTTDYLRAFLPHFLNVFWFINAYLIFYLLSPFFKSMLRSVNRNQLLLYLGLLGIFLMIMQVNQYDLFPIRFIGFIEVTLIGSYLSMYMPRWLQKTSRAAILTGFCSIVLFGVVVMINILGQAHPFWAGKGYFFCRFYDILVLPLCIFLFVTFKNIRMPVNRGINLLAGSVFGIYLIHENYFYRFYALPDIFLRYYQDSLGSFIAIATILILVEFFAALLLDQLTRRYIEKPLSKVIGKRMNVAFDKIDGWMKRIV